MFVTNLKHLALHQEDSEAKNMRWKWVNHCTNYQLFTMLKWHESQQYEGQRTCLVCRWRRLGHSVKLEKKKKEKENIKEVTVWRAWRGGQGCGHRAWEVAEGWHSSCPGLSPPPAAPNDERADAGEAKPRKQKQRDLLPLKRFCLPGALRSPAGGTVRCTATASDGNLLL